MRRTHCVDSIPLLGLVPEELVFMLGAKHPRLAVRELIKALEDKDWTTWLPDFRDRGSSSQVEAGA